MTRHLAVGVGASFAECKAASLPDELCLPLIGSFARKLWKDFNPAFVLRAYLQENGIEIPAGADVRDIFFNLERTRPTDFNIELFFAYLWNNPNRFTDEWENLAYHLILSPMVLMLSQGLWRQGNIVEAGYVISSLTLGRTDRRNASCRISPSRRSPVSEVCRSGVFLLAFATPQD